MPALVVALALTFTRSAWVGVFAGVGVLFMLKDRRLVGVLPIVVGACSSRVAPAAVTDRVVLDVRPERPDQPRPRGDAARPGGRWCATIR